MGCFQFPVLSLAPITNASLTFTLDHDELSKNLLLFMESQTNLIKPENNMETPFKRRNHTHEKSA